MQKIKCVAVGDSTVGKSCMLISYLTNKFPSEYLPTCYDNFVTVMVGGEPLQLVLGDTKGEGDYDRLRPLNYPHTDVFLVCFSVVSPTSCDNVSKKWVPDITKNCGRGTQFLLVGTQIDLRENEQMIERLAKMRQKPISFEMGQKLAKDLKAHKYVECSALTQKGLKNVFDEAILAAFELPEKRNKQTCVLL